MVQCVAMSSLGERDLLPVVPAGHGAPCVPLPMLIEYAVQRVYHELTVLAELLPKKLDLERKVSIIHFAHTTRMLFIRLLAVVKWLKASTKIDYCSAIGYFLDQHAAYFVDTADKLFAIREELAHARLPMFHIPVAVDVLTLGSYPRLPLCIKEQFVGNEPLTRKERQCVLQRLNQCIQYRLALDAANLPHKLTNIRVLNGTVELEVAGEFSCTLTMLGTERDTPWTLLNVAILVDAAELGDGAPLVHALQLDYLHRIVQARMDNASRPLIELYDILHTFCVGLQLDVLYCRACNAIQDRLTPANCLVHQYVPGSALAVAYWPRPGARAGKHAMSYTLLIKTERTEHKGSAATGGSSQPDVELVVRHEPLSHSVGGSLPSGVALHGDSAGSFDELLTQTMLVRCRHKLKALQPVLRHVMGGAKVVFAGSAMPSLCTAPLGRRSQCRRGELLTVSVHVFSGRLVLALPLLHDDESVRRLRLALEANEHKAMATAVADLRRALLLRRYERAAAHLPVRLAASGHWAKRHGHGDDDERSLSLKFLRDPDYVLRVCVPREGSEPEYTVQYKSVSVLPPSAAAHAQHNVHVVRAKVDLRKLMAVGKRKCNEPVASTAAKRRRPSAAKVDVCPPDLSAVVAALDRRIGAHQAAVALAHAGIRYQLMHSDTVTLISYRIIQLERVCADDASVVSTFWRRCVRRAVLHMNWLNADRCTAVFELVADAVLQAADCRRSSTRLEKVEFGCSTGEQLRDGLKEVLAVVTSMARLHPPVYRLACALRSGHTGGDGEKPLSQLIQVKAFAHMCLILAYGEHYMYNVSVRWRAADRAFHLSFGTVSGMAADESAGATAARPRANPHLLVAHLFQANVKRADGDGPDLVHLAYTLAQSWRALDALQSLRDINALAPPRMPASATSMPLVDLRPTLKFHIVPVTETHMRCIYAGRACLEVLACRNERVALRDAQSAGSAALVALAQLCTRYAPDGVDIDYEPVEHNRAPRAGSPSHGGASLAASIGSVPAPSPSGPPSHMSLMTPVPTPVPPSPAQLYSVGTPGNPDSVDPPPRSVGVAEKSMHDRSFGTSQCGPGAGASSSPVVVPVSVLSALCRRPDNGTARCPLEAYFSAVVSVDAIGRALVQASANASDPIRECVVDVTHRGGCVRARVPSADDRSAIDVDIRVDPTAGEHMLQARFHFVLKGTSQGVEPVAAADLETLSRFVCARVAPFELSVAYVSVVTLLRQHCRPGLVRSLANVMRREMECTLDGQSGHFCQLCPVQSRTTLDNQIGLQPGIWTDNKGIKLLFWLRPMRSEGGRVAVTPLTPQPLGIVYDFTTRTCSLYKAHVPADVHHRLTNLVETCNQEGRATADGCPIWTLARNLVENFAWPG